jgi:phosphoribosylformylglycinamidine synthase
VKNTWKFLEDLYTQKLVKANHDVNKGGFLITIAELGFKNLFGADLELSNLLNENMRDDELLFSESHGRFIIETAPENFPEIKELAEKNNVFFRKIGKVSNKPEISVTGLKSEPFVLDLNKMRELYDSKIPDLMEI